MHLFRVVSAGFFLLHPGFAFAQEWVEYVDRKEYFQINFPGQPAVRDITYQGEDGETLPARVYTAKEGPATYTLTVVNYRDSETVAGAGGYRGSTAYAVWNFLQRGGELTHLAYAQTDRIAGIQLQITNPDKTRSYIGIHPHMRRLYIMEATAPPDYPPPSDFPQTLSILDEQGRRIRYEVDDEGNRVGRNEDARRLYENVP
jgi:hypothetical protein